MELTEDWFKSKGFDTSKNPYVMTAGAKTTKVHKNYVRDASGRWDGYLLEHVVIERFNTEEELLAIL